MTKTQQMIDERCDRPGCVLHSRSDYYDMEGRCTNCGSGPFVVRRSKGQHASDAVCPNCGVRAVTHSPTARFPTSQ